MIIVIARCEFEPQAIERLRPVLDAMMRSTWEESGCLSYSMAIECESSGLVSIVERWTDEAALRAHFDTAHMAAFKAATDGVVRSLDARIYDATGERPLHIPA